MAETFKAKIISRNRITIPYEIMLLMNFSEGEIISVSVDKIHPKQPCGMVGQGSPSGESQRGERLPVFELMSLGAGGVEIKR